MKKRTIFLLILLSFIIYKALYHVFIPKITFINQSGYDMYIFGKYVDNANTIKNDPNEEPNQRKSRFLGKDKETNYYLGFFPNKWGKESVFWADWTIPDKRRNDGAFVQNELTLPKEDFGWKNVTFIIDENGDYHKIDKNTK